jgi:hypothetical protein
MGRHFLYSTCTLPDCERPHIAKGFCGLHYQRFVNSGNLAKGRASCMSEEEMRIYFTSLFVVDSDGCWIWQTQRSQKYGLFFGEQAHRYSYRTFIGLIPENLFVLHSCDKRKCVNPRDLFVGTNADNARDAAQKCRLPWQKTSMSREKVNRIIEARNRGQKLLSIAVQFGISESGVSRIVNGSRWQLRHDDLLREVTTAI